MENRVLIDTNQKVDVDDFNNFGLYPTQSLDHVVGDLGIPDLAFVGFGVTKSAAARVLVGAGRFFGVGKVYYNDNSGGTEIDFISSLPTVTQRWAAITTWGIETASDPEPRTFLTDALTRATEARVTTTTMRRWANLGPVMGAVGPDPVKPAVPSDVIAVAWVLLDPSGVVSIERNEAGVAPNLRELDNRLNDNDVWRAQTGTRIDTLGSDLAGLARRISGTASLAFVVDLAADVARTKNILRLPAAWTAWHADVFLTLDGSDPTHVDWLAKVEEGIRFPDAAVSDSQLGLLNGVDPSVIQRDFFVLPAYTEFSRVSSVGFDDEQAIAQYPFTALAYVKKTRTRIRWRYGPVSTVCTNMINIWQNVGLGTFDPVDYIFRFNTGEVFQIVPEDRAKGTQHVVVRWQQVWYDGWENVEYWEQVVQNLSASGSVISQTFLNSQDGWMTSLDIGFTRVGATGDVRILICDVENGRPLAESVIAETVVASPDLEVYPTLTHVPFVPTFMRAGKRYGVILSTPGNHFVALTVGNKFAQGTLFYIVDGAWAQADPARDLCFRANFARFNTPRLEVQMLPLTLTGGIATVDILAQAIIPPQCSISHEVQVPGIGWVTLDDQVGVNPHPLNGLPALVPYRIVLNGTTESMPGFGVGVNSRTRTSRPRSDFRHISAIISHPSSGTIKHTVRLEHWRGNPHHTYLLRLLTGAGYTTVTAPSVLSSIPAPDDPLNAIIVSATWAITAVTSHRLRIEGTTDNVLTPFLVAERVDVET